MSLPRPCQGKPTQAAAVIRPVDKANYFRVIVDNHIANGKASAMSRTIHRELANAHGAVLRVAVLLA